MSIKLSERIKSYQDISDIKLMSRVPLVICLNGRSFSKSTELLDKPYCSKFAECILSTMLKLCNDIGGALFAYQYNDEIVIIARNDQNVDTAAWYDNKLQKMCSITSSIASLHFSKCASAIELNLTGEPIFSSQIFTVPNIMEVSNTIIYKQQSNLYTSIQLACFYELLKKYDKLTIKEMLSGLNIDEKIDLLYQECDIDFNQYPIHFRRGAACYKAPKIVDGNMKNKWTVNNDLPIFTKEQSFLTNIFRLGADLFRDTSL